jgi:hypothetical protein
MMAFESWAWQFSVRDRDGDSVPDSDPVNVIVLVPSDAVAGEWERYANETAHVGDLKALVPRLKDGHLYVASQRPRPSTIVAT